MNPRGRVPTGSQGQPLGPLGHPGSSIFPVNTRRGNSGFIRISNGEVVETVQYNCSNIFSELNYLYLYIHVLRYSNSHYLLHDSLICDYIYEPLMNPHLPVFPVLRTLAVR